MKWGSDSDEVGQRQSEATRVMAMITEVPHFSQVFFGLVRGGRAIGIISFPSSRFSPDERSERSGASEPLVRRTYDGPGVPLNPKTRALDARIVPAIIRPIEFRDPDAVSVLDDRLRSRTPHGSGEQQ